METEQEAFLKFGIVVLIGWFIARPLLMKLADWMVERKSK